MRRVSAAWVRAMEMLSVNASLAFRARSKPSSMISRVCAIEVSTRFHPWSIAAEKLECLACARASNSDKKLSINFMLACALSSSDSLDGMVSWKRASRVSTHIFALCFAAPHISSPEADEHESRTASSAA